MASNNDNEGPVEEFEEVEEQIYHLPGRKPKNPQKKIGSSNRFLSTPPIEKLLERVAAGEPYSFQKSDYIRLAVLNQLHQDGLLTVEILADPTWDTLRLNTHTAKRISELANELQGK